MIDSQSFWFLPKVKVSRTAGHRKDIQATESFPTDVIQLKYDSQKTGDCFTKHVVFYNSLGTQTALGSSISADNTKGHDHKSQKRQ